MDEPLLVWKSGKSKENLSCKLRCVLFTSIDFSNRSIWRACIAYDFDLEKNETTWHTRRISQKHTHHTKIIPNGILMMLTIDFPNNLLPNLFYFCWFWCQNSEYILCRSDDVMRKSTHDGNHLVLCVHENLITENIKLKSKYVLNVGKCFAENSVWAQ